jgi:transposase-like protein
MTKKTRRKFTDQEKEKAVAEYLSGTKSAKDIAQELGVEVHAIYHWRASMDDKKRESRLSGLTSQGVPKEVAERLIRQQEEIEAYQKKVAEQAVIIDLLKKLQTSSNFPPESELSGLIATMKKSDQKKKRVK